MPDTSTSELDLRAFFGVLWRRKWSILLIVALTTGSALFFSYRRTAVYSSTAEVQVTPLTGSQILTANPYWTLANMDNEIHVVQSTAVAVLAGKAIEDRAGSGTLSVEVPTNTQILQIGYSHADPETARDQLRAMLKDGAPPPEAPFTGYEVLEPARDYKNRHASIMLALEATVEAVSNAARA